MKKIKFPFITILIIGVLVAVYILSQTIITSQRDSIDEEEMRINALKNEIFSKYFNINFLNSYNRGDKDFIEYSDDMFEEFINYFLSSDEFANESGNYKIHIKATLESLQSKENSYILNNLGVKKTANPVLALLSSATSLFIHLNPLHLVLILLMFWILGINAEKVQGFWYFFLLFGGGVLTNFLGTFISPDQIFYYGFAPAVAFSLGAYLVHNYDEQAYIIFPGLPQVYGIFLLVPWVIIEAVQAILIQSDLYKSFNFMHIGGLLMGGGIAAVMKIGRPQLESAMEREEMTPVALAKRDMRMNNYKGAITRLGDILKRDSTNEEALQLMLKCYLSSRGQQDCINLISFLIPDLVQKRRNKTAFSLYMDFSSAHPSAVLPLKAQYHAGKLLAENSFYEMAVTTLGQVAQSSPGSEEGIQSVFEIGKIQLQQLNQPQQAAGMFNWIIQNFPAHPIAGTARNFLQQIQSGR